MNDAEKKIFAVRTVQTLNAGAKCRQKLLTYYEQRQTIEAAEKFLANLSALPTNKLSIDSDLFIESNATISALKNSARWFSTIDLPHEIWRDIEGYEGFYNVSNLNRIKSFHKSKPRILTNSKTRVEMIAIFNATGFVPSVIGGHGVATKPGTEA